MRNGTKISMEFNLQTSLHFSVCIAALIVNSFVLVVVWKDPRKCFRTRSAMLITNLMISDLFVTVVNIARTLYKTWLKEHLEAEQMNIALTIGYFDALVVSLLTIFLISVEHLLAITQPIKLKINVTKKRIYVMIISTWLGSTVTVSMLYYIPGQQNELFQAITACSALLFIALPTIYLRAFFSLRKQSKAIKAIDASCSDKYGKQKRIAQQRNFLLTSAALVMSYVLTCAPFIFYQYLETSRDGNYNMYMEGDKLGLYLWIVLHFNLFLDPFLYCLRIPQYRKSCIALLCKGRRI